MVEEIKDTKVAPEKQSVPLEGKEKKTEEKVEAKAEEVKKEDVKVEAKAEEVKVEKKVESKPAVAKVGKVKKEVKGDAAELTREYIVPMRKGFMNVPHYRRAKKAVKTLKEFMVRHMNIRDNDTRKVKVDITLNNEIWFRGIKNPLAKIKVKAVKKDGIVTVTLADPSDYVKFKLAREAKARAKAVAGAEKVKPAKKEKEVADKDGDGVEDKKEEEEDKRAGAEKAAKTAKIKDNAEKHSAKGEHKQKIASTKGLK